MLIGANEDNDEYADDEDSCDNTSPTNLALGDSDGDGCYGAEDDFPNDPTEHADGDGDGVGDNADLCPNTSPEELAAGAGGTIGCYGGQTPDPTVTPMDEFFMVSNLRAYPTGATSVRLEWTNPDSANITAFIIAYSSEGAVHVDNTRYTPADGSADTNRNAAVNRTVTGLSATNGAYTFSVLVIFAEDSGKTGRAVSVLDHTGTEGRRVILGTNDDDDEYADANNGDLCPNTPPANLARSDTDGDGCYGSEDAFPDNPAEATDSDGDGIGDNADLCPNTPPANLARSDTDGDGCYGSEDAFPDNPAEATDSDGDGIGDNADLDDDNDGINDLRPDGTVLDNCRLVANRNQLNLFGDDSIGDACDDQDSDGVVDLVDNCPLVGNRDQARAANHGVGTACDDTDDDNDGTLDAMDVDADGNGLIEISSHEQLNAIRFNLDGSGLEIRDSDNNNHSGGSMMGCNSRNDNNYAASCRGYELTRDLDLSSYTNWEPIGDCVGKTYCDVNTALDDNTNFVGKFNATLNGNGYSISNLRIILLNNDAAFGLFGAASPHSEFRNLRLVGVNITRVTGVVVPYVGGLLGYAAGNNLAGGVSIHNVAVNASSIAASGSFGGLAGAMWYATATSNYAEVGNINAYGGPAGGLVGSATSADLISNRVKIDAVSAVNVNGFIADNIGGSVGNAVDSMLISNYAEVGRIMGDGVVGGLIANSHNSVINSNYAEVGSITGANALGGLIGQEEEEGIIISSYAKVGSIIGSRAAVGGLIGNGGRSSISSSYAKVGAITGEFEVGGLAGRLIAGRVNSSYAVTVALNATRVSGVGVGIVDGLLGVGSATDGRAGNISVEVSASYWDNSVIYSVPAGSARNASGFGAAQSASALQTPTSASGIYATWGDDVCADGSPAWDFGTSSQFPALTCFGAENLAAQRADHASFLERHPDY